MFIFRLITFLYKTLLRIHFLNTHINSLKTLFKIYKMPATNIGPSHVRHYTYKLKYFRLCEFEIMMNNATHTSHTQELIFRSFQLNFQFIKYNLYVYSTSWYDKYIFVKMSLTSQVIKMYLYSKFLVFTFVCPSGKCI